MRRQERLSHFQGIYTMGGNKELRILNSATKRGFTNEDIIHALFNFIDRFEDQGDHELTMFIGPARDGSLLEIGAIEDESAARIIHAMRVRKKYWPPGNR